MCVCVLQVWCNTWKYHPVWSEHRHRAHHRPGCSLWMCCCHPTLPTYVRAEGGLSRHTEDLLLRCLPQVSVWHAHSEKHNGNKSWARLCFNLISINVTKSSNNPPATLRGHIKSAILFRGRVNIIPKVFQGMLLCLKVSSIQKCWISSLEGIQEVLLLKRP